MGDGLIALLRGQGVGILEQALPAYFRQRRWFGGKARSIAATSVEDVFLLDVPAGDVALTLVEVRYLEGLEERYLLPLAYAGPEDAARIAERYPDAIITRVGSADDGAAVYDALVEESFCRALLALVGAGKTLAGSTGATHGQPGTLVAEPTPAYGELAHDAAALPATLLAREQSNSSIAFGERLIMKVFRSLKPGTNPELEIGRFLTTRTSFHHTARLVGSLEHRHPGAEPETLAILQEYVANQGDAWGYTLESIAGFYAAVQGRSLPAPEPLSPLQAAHVEPPPELASAIGGYLDSARLLGRRTAELHLALASAPDDPAFAPEPFDQSYGRATYESIAALALGVFKAMRLLVESSAAAALALPPQAVAQARELLAREAQVLGRLEPLRAGTLAGLRTRTHGDYHLGQVLYTGDDFVIIDFEGEPLRSVQERRVKHSPLRDVAGMLRSFHYAAYAGLFAAAEDEARAALEPAARLWNQWVAGSFLRAYLSGAAGAAFLPAEQVERERLLALYLLEKALYELQYELNNRPGWVPIPLQGLGELIQ